MSHSLTEVCFCAWGGNELTIAREKQEPVWYVTLVVEPAKSNVGSVKIFTLSDSKSIMALGKQTPCYCGMNSASGAESRVHSG